MSKCAIIYFSVKKHFSCMSFAFIPTFLWESFANMETFRTFPWIEGGRLNYLARCCCSGWANICNWYLPFCENEPICVCSVVAPKTPMLLLAPLFIVMPMALRRVAVRAIERGTCATLQSRHYEKQTNGRRKSMLVLVKTSCENPNWRWWWWGWWSFPMMSEKQWKA